MEPEKNVIGTPLEVCGLSPATGFERDGSCRYAAYAFEVWRVGFDPETLLPAGQRIATFEIEARHGR